MAQLKCLLTAYCWEILGRTNHVHYFQTQLTKSCLVVWFWIDKRPVFCFFLSIKHSLDTQTMSLPLFFLTAIWLPHGQLWATIEGTASLTLMLITAFFYIFEPRNEVGSLSPAKRLVGFEPATFRFLLPCLNPLGHSLTLKDFYLCSRSTARYNIVIK